MAGFRGYYVPESMAFHKGRATFEPQLGTELCDELDSRNTLIFMWKNTGGARLLSHFMRGFPSGLLARAPEGQAQLCQGTCWGGCSSKRVRSWRPAVRWPWGRGPGSKDKRHSSGVFSGRTAVVCRVRAAQGPALEPHGGV